MAVYAQRFKGKIDDEKLNEMFNPLRKSLVKHINERAAEGAQVDLFMMVECLDAEEESDKEND